MSDLLFPKTGEEPTISFACLSCGGKFKVAAKYAGREGHCTKCGQKMTVPQASDETAQALGNPFEPAKSLVEEGRFAEAIDLLRYHAENGVRLDEATWDLFRRATLADKICKGLDSAQRLAEEGDTKAAARQLEHLRTPEMEASLFERWLDLNEMVCAIVEEHAAHSAPA